MRSKLKFLNLNISKTKILATLGVIAVLFMPATALADQFDAQIKALNAQISQNQSAANQKANEANTLQNKISQLNSQIAAAQAALNKTNVEIAQTNAQIDQANKDLDRQKAILKDNLRIIYKQGEVSPIEVVASSKDLSDFVAQQEYLSAIKKKIDDNLKKIDQLKKELDTKKNSLVGLQTNQQAQSNNISAQKAEQAGLLAQTQGDEAKYQQSVAASKQALQGIYAARAAIDAANHVNVSVGGTGGYPYANATPDMPDPWSFLTRECTSYAAWKRRAMGRQPYPYMWGNAGNWPGSYVAPSVGAVAVFPPGVGGAGGVGHVAIVEKVNGDGTMDVSEYNWRPFQYSYRSGVPIGGVKFIN
jgi:peptidoglycan hydrolase CwlO-like protein